MTTVQQKSKMVAIGGYFSIFCVVYSIIMIASIYMNLTQVKNELRVQIRTAQINTDQQLINLFLAGMDADNIPIDEKDITIIRADNSVEMKVVYNDTFTFFKVPIKKFKFEVSKKDSVRY